VVNRKQTSLFLLIFSFAIYVRDAGVAGSNPATPTILPKVDVFQRLGGPAASASGALFATIFGAGPRPIWLGRGGLFRRHGFLFAGIDGPALCGRSEDYHPAASEPIKSAAKQGPPRGFL
jgi:hypothetical protein